MKLCCFCTLALFVITLRMSAQYGNHSQLGNRIKALDQKEDMFNASTLVTTHGGKEVFLVTIGKGKPDSKPGIAVVGGIQGTSLASTEIIMQMMEKLSGHPSFTEEVTFYFFPDVSPDASEQYFDPIRYERNENARPGDDDRDGMTDEDGYDDLNQDGLITWMRIKDAEKGDYMIHPENPSVMVKADIAKRQQGEYIVMYEGIDNDKDGRFNEDPPGGVIFNKNFSYNYPYHSKGAGENALSEEETRSMAKFLFDHWNIFAVLCIGSENNLSEYNDLKLDFADKNIPAMVNEKDKPYFESVVDLYKKNNRLNDSAKTAPSGGDFLSWAYFHYNRFSFSTPAWNVSKNKNNLGSKEFDFLTWASGSGLKDLVVAWQKTDHPDFPDKVVEIGGIKPFLMNNPPPAVLDTISDRHLDFLLALAAMHPALAFNEIKITKRSEDLFMLEVEITNSGNLPTMTAQAAGSKWLKKVRLDINTAKSQQVIGGKNVFLFERIVPGETVKAAWLIKGKGKISLKAGSPHTGFVNRDIELN